MRKAIILTIALLFLTLSPASAYYYSVDPFYTDKPRFALDTKISYHFSPEANIYQYYRKCTYCEPWRDGWREDIAEAYALGWAVNSYNQRYKIASGRSSGDVFYQTTINEQVPESNWRNKPAFDGRRYSQRSYKENYYEPSFDSDLGYYNWRY